MFWLNALSILAACVVCMGYAFLLTLIYMSVN